MPHTKRIYSQMRRLPQNTDINRPVLLRVLGMPSRINKELGSFNFDAQSFTSALRETGWLGLSATMSPIRYGKMEKKPLPSTSPTLIECFADGATFTDDNKLDRLQVIVERIAFPSQCRLPVSVSKGMLCRILFCITYRC
jgi:hypothetical protein